MDRSIRLKTKYERERDDKWKPEYGTVKFPQPSDEKLKQRKEDIKKHELPF